MKTSLCCAALFALSLAGTGWAQTLETSTSSVGLTNYGDHISFELRQIQAQLDSAVQRTPLTGQAELAPSLDALAVAQQALGEFKTASSLELDRRQVALAAAKARLADIWTAYRNSHRSMLSRENSPASASVD